MSNEEMEFNWNAGGQEPMDFSPIKPGKYQVCIVETKLALTRNNDTMVETHCVIDQDESRGRHIWHRVAFIQHGKPGAGIAVHFLKTIGEPFDINADFNVKPTSWLGKRFLATVVNDRYINPKTNEENITNKITGVEPVPADQAVNKELVKKYAQKSASAATSDEVVPF